MEQRALSHTHTTRRVTRANSHSAPAAAAAAAGLSPTPLLYIADFNLALVHLALYANTHTQKKRRKRRVCFPRCCCLVPKVVYVKPRAELLKFMGRNHLLFTRSYTQVAQRSLIGLEFGRSLSACCKLGRCV